MDNDSKRELLSATAALAPLIREHSKQSESQRHLAREVADAFVELNLYRLPAPIGLQGLDVDLTTQMAVIESVSTADASAGWNLMIGMETFGLVSPSMVTCKDLLSDQKTVMASSTANAGTAEPQDGGWLINGQWGFASGVHNAQIFGATVVRSNDTNDPPIRHYAIAKEGEFEILDTWHVAGLRGSGSHDVKISNLWIPDSRLVATLGHGSMKSNQLKIPLGVRLTFAKVGVALGTARAVIDTFVELASVKSPFGSRRQLSERPFAQRAVAQAELRLHSIRAAIYEHAEVVWHECITEGKELSGKDRALAHLLSSDAAQAAVDVTETILQAAGVTANRLDSPLEKLSRDVRVIRQHATVAPHHIDDIARLLIGLEPRGILQM